MAFKRFRQHRFNGKFLEYAGGCLAILVATLISQQLHRAGLPEYLTLYPLAVAAVSALWGIRHGLFAALLSVALTSLGLADHFVVDPPARIEGFRLLTIAFSSFAAAALVGVVREQRDQLERAARALEERQTQLVVMHAELQEAEVRRDEFCRDILLAVSRGKLRLSAPEEMRIEAGPPLLQASLEVPSDITTLRHAVSDLALSLGMERERVQDLSVCLGEATTNAIVHGGGGQATLYADPETFWLHIVDNGPGIDRQELPRATLVKGYSTRASLGMGFSIMQELSDSIRLCTGPEGTQVLLEMKIQPPAQDALDLSLLGIDLEDTWDSVSLPSAS